jgi:phosphoesterase RecJ-like protein
VSAALRAARHVVLAGHVNLDGDALGSALALAGGLAASGRTARILADRPLPRAFRFLDPEGLVSVGADDARTRVWLAEADLVIVLDNNSWSRLGSLERPIRESGARVICIDHHPAEAPFSADHLVDVGAAATGVLVYELLRGLGWGLGPSAADALYTSLVNDTGWVRHGNTDARVLRVAADLVAAGADPALIDRELNARERLEGKRLLGLFLRTIEVFAGGRCALGVVTAESLDATGGLPEETEDFIQHVRTLEGVVLAGLLREDGPGVCKLSLRSSAPVSARAVAAGFGGGGHERAAGATLQGPLDDLVVRVRSAMQVGVGVA